MDERLDAPVELLEVPGLRTGRATAERRGARARRAPPPSVRRPGLERGGEGRRRGDPASTCSSASARSRTRIAGDQLKIAVADPTNVQAIDELRLATRYTLEIGVAAAGGDRPRAEAPAEGRRGAWERAALVEEEFDLGDEDEEEGDDLEADDGVSDAPLVRLVNSIILQAAEDGASDIHFDPQDDALVVRSRVDGVLHEVQRIPKRLAPGVTTRLKVLAKLDIAERRKPQDGRISLNAKAAGRLLDIRVAVLPTVEGEGVVMRLLDKSRRPPTLAELGLSEEMRDDLRGDRRQADGRAARHRADRLR